MSMVDPKYGLVAALFTRMSMLPNRSMQCSTAASACSGSPALAATTSMSPPISSAAARRSSILREEMRTDAPASAYALAIALPMPREAPVTSATLPAREISTAGRYREASP
jgi:hypothetical protein